MSWSLPLHLSLCYPSISVSVPKVPFGAAHHPRNFGFSAHPPEKPSAGSRELPGKSIRLPPGLTSLRLLLRGNKTP